MATAGDALDTLGIGITERALVAAIIDVIATFPVVERHGSPQSELTAADVEALERGGMDLTARDYGANDPMLRARVEYGALIASGLSVSEVAAKLGTTTARVRQRLKERTLYGVKRGDEWRLPSFQFLGDGSPVPGIERVLPGLDPHLNPVSVLHWFTQKDTDLRIGGEEVSPRAWLMAGYDPEHVRRQAAAL